MENELGIWSFRRSGYFYAPTFSIPNPSSSGYTLDTGLLYAVPFGVSRDERFDRIGVYAMSYEPGLMARLGIYNSKNFYPDTLVVDAGEIEFIESRMLDVDIDQVLIPGLYWLCITVSDNSESENFGNNSIKFTEWGSDILGDVSPGFGIIMNGLECEFDYASLPLNWPGFGSDESMMGPYIELRKA